MKTLLWISCLFAASVTVADIGVNDLRCEYLVAPLAIDVDAPRLSWKIADSRGARGQTQSAYQILVASSVELLGQDKADLWNSRKVVSDQQNQIAYAGAPLKSRMQCFWKVRIWDGKGKSSTWSDSATWSMGLLSLEDWHAKWIGARATLAEPQPPADGRLGFHALEALADEPKWVQVDLGKPTPVEQVSLHAMRHRDGDRHIDGFGFPVRFRIEASDDAHFSTSAVLVDKTDADVPNPGHSISTFDVTPTTARYVRVTATKLWDRGTGDKPFCFALAQMLVMSGGRNAARRAAVSAKDSVEDWGWGKPYLTDGRRFTGKIKAKSQADAVAMDPGATVQVRREFTIDKEIKRAVVYACGLGYYELRLNGEKVGDRVLEPGWTNYRKTCLYAAYDVSTLLKRGGNALGVMLGNSMYNFPAGSVRYQKIKNTFGPAKVILQLYIEHADGTTAMVTTDKTWAWSPSPVTFSCLYGGEDYDARMELPGWDAPGFTSRAFTPVLEVDGPGGRLSSQAAPPIKVMHTYKPAKITEPRPGVWVYDFGQNCSSILKLSAKGPAGARVRLIPGELLHSNGLVSQDSSGKPVWCTYTFKGQGTETWEPRFFYYGSRYIQVEFSDVPAGSAPGMIQLESQFVRSSAETVGDFTCSNPTVNRIHELINAAIKSNLQSVLTDCPHREKLGWLECAHLLSDCIMFNYDVPTFYAKIVNDMSEAQTDEGMIPSIAPEFIVHGGDYRDSPEWGSSYVIAPWRVYLMYGDRSLIDKHYEGMKRYVKYLGSKARDHIVPYGLSDWYDLSPVGVGTYSTITPMGLTATAVYYQDIVVMMKAARLLGKTDDTREFEALAQRVKEAFNHRFFLPDGNHYQLNSQTGKAMPLTLGIVPEKHRAAVMKSLVEDIRASGNRITSGDIGFYYLVTALMQGGHADLLYDMMLQDKGPGYVAILNKGATTLTEAWDGGSSQNHAMLGHIEKWLYNGLGGILPDPSGPGFKRFILKPHIPKDLQSAKAGYASSYGRIASEWQREGTALAWMVTVPVNTSATVYVPAKDAGSVTEGGKPGAQAKGLTFLRTENDYVVYSAGSGTYQFRSTLP